MTVRDNRPPYFGEKVCVVLGAMPITAQEAQDIAGLPRCFLICADAGLENARAYGLTPDLTLGDFDSLAGGEPDIEGEKLTFPVEKDDTDTMLGIKEGLDRGYRRFLLYGSLGGRLDHTIANIASLRYLLDHGARAVHDEDAERVHELVRRARLLAHGVGVVARCTGVQVAGLAGGDAQLHLGGLSRQGQPLQPVGGRAAPEATRQQGGA